ncbi:MAG: hypothetical protein ABSG04_13190 [Verrucomicrobiota bacterium]
MKSNLIEPLNDEQITRGKKEECGHLQAAAPSAQLDSSPPERNQAAASAISSIDLIAAQAGTTVQALRGLFSPRCDGYHHWGLNE